MMEIVTFPDSLSPTIAWGFVFLSFFTSLLTASFGLGGGAVLLAVMAQTMPVTALIPVHGAVQTGSNLGRALIMWPDVRWDLLRWFLLGSLVGALIGGNLVISLPKDLLRGLLGAFILFSVWGASWRIDNINRPLLSGGGFFTTFLSMFVGVAGPLVVAFIRAFGLSSVGLVATTAACMASQHILKIVIFSLLGFAFAPYFPLIGLMIVSGFFGTLAGRKILLKIDQKKFSFILNIILTVLALRLIFTAVLD
ncbi:MAG: sulfite exporter TauE/SafE family protein [Gammaproteobacteria bacterium]|nr:sulfite exporter TauE/SafE family protein [Gammaproteobacteria bacterium]